MLELHDHDGASDISTVMADYCWPLGWISRNVPFNRMYPGDLRCNSLAIEKPDAISRSAAPLDRFDCLIMETEESADFEEGKNT